ncbi:hypothetical protein NDU88_003840 [Pleurodeles waltl]|uniref:Integrase catalytic domain-containing protein n=1 Tax=Pleurodeles waltl TaxID=8319 RepID=A0AAV7PAQ3_PLEWA|nr:hypothetical protein NDU88_003840 [Pleurodeles waltl]
MWRYSSSSQIQEQTLEQSMVSRTRPEDGKVVKSWPACQASRQPDPPAPVITEDDPKTQWKHISVDYGSLLNGSHVLIVINNFSRYPEMEIVQTTSTGDVIPKVAKMMATNDLFEEIHTDNGPPFNSHKLTEYLRSQNTKHCWITPHWPQAKGKVEQFVRTFTKVIHITVA